MSSAEQSPKRRSRFKRTLIFLGGIFAAWLVIQLWPVWLQPGPQTTVITGPLRPDGTIDYAAAINSENSTGVTPENNAVVLLMQVFGPEIIDSSIRAEYFRQLGIEEPPVAGTYFQSLESLYAQDPEHLSRLHDEMEHAMSAPWSEADHPELCHWLSINKAPMEICAQACRRERFFDPLLPPAGRPLLEAFLDLCQQTRGIARFLAARIPFHLQAGNVQEALTDAETLHRLSRLLSQHSSLIPQLVAYTQLSIAAKGDYLIIQSGLLSTEQARNQRRMMSELPPFPPLVKIINHGSRLETLDAVQHTMMGGPQMNVWGLAHPNVVLSRVNSTYDQLIAAMKVEDLQLQKDALAEFRKKCSERVRPTWGTVGLFFLINPRRTIASRTGDTLATLLIPAADQALIAEQRMKVRRELNQVGYALAEYRALHGEFPENLELLVPDLLESAPHDPYGKGPMRYVMNRNQGTVLLYSIGENGVDNGGLLDRRLADDIGYGAVPKSTE